MTRRDRIPYNSDLWILRFGAYEWLRIPGGAKSPDATARRGIGAARSAASGRTRGRNKAHPGEVRRPACRDVRKSRRRISGRAQEKSAPDRRPSVVAGSKL